MLPLSLLVVLQSGGERLRTDCSNCYLASLPEIRRLEILKLKALVGESL